MQQHSLWALVVALSMGVSTVAQAQPQGGGHGGGPPPQNRPSGGGHGGHPGGQPPHGGNHGGHPGGPPPGYNRPGMPPPGYGGGPHRPGYGVGPDRNWVEGSRLPPYYRGRYYVVDNWHVHGLRPPPRGYHWVQYGPDYLLVAITTGIITSIILNSAY